MSKYQLRQHFLALRQKINAEYRDKAAILAAEHFAALPLFAASKDIACYSAFKDEFNALPLIEAVWQARKNCYLPVLTKEKSLIFVRYRYGDPLHKNRYGILEPHVSDEIPAQQLDMVVLPLIAFDASGGRLGTGGGYYDRTFSFLGNDAELSPAKVPLKKPHLLGLAFANQVSQKALPIDPWDIPIEAVITEKGVISIKS